jgi:serine-type D-Ala-D-Ala carboxypeptidase (penicillin-binding protein 5/6)
LSGTTVIGERSRPAVPRGVLTPVVRRRRRGPGRLLVVALIAAIAGATAVLVLHERSARSPVRAAKAHAATKPAHASAPRVKRPQPLVLWPARSRRWLDPPVAARGAVVVDAQSGRVLWAFHARRHLPVASTTKIMTALLALQRLRPDAVVSVAFDATRVPLVREGLRPHERVRAWKLLDGLLIYSGNDDAYALAVATAGSRTAFVERMNEEAAKLGLHDTRFSSPSGVIDSGNYSSAADLAGLTRVALQNARFRRVVRTRIARVPWSAPTFAKTYVNKNALLGRYPGADGVKTGWTTLAGHCLVASATRRGRTIVAVLLNDPQMYRDAKRLLDLGFETRG